MKKALISPGEKRIDKNGNEGARVCGVCEVPFDVAQPLFWVDCPDDCEMDKWVYTDGVLIKNEENSNVVDPEVVLNVLDDI